MHVIGSVWWKEPRGEGALVCVGERMVSRGGRESWNTRDKGGRKGGVHLGYGHE
jgi:hypothetical protein